MSDINQIIVAFAESLSAYKFFTTVDRRKTVHAALLVESKDEGEFLDLLCDSPGEKAVAAAKGADGVRQAFDRWLNAGHSLLEFVVIVRVRKQADLAAALAKHDARIHTLYEWLVVPSDDVTVAARAKVDAMVRLAKEGKQCAPVRDQVPCGVPRDDDKLDARPLVWLHCAIDDEAKAAKPVLERVFNAKFARFKCAGWSHWRLDAGSFILCLGRNGGNDAQGAGPTARALGAIVSAYKPAFFAMIGCCGGAAKRVKPGDVILVARSVPYMLGSQDKDHFRSDASQAVVLDRDLESRVLDCCEEEGEWWQYVCSEEDDEDPLAVLEGRKPRIVSGAVLCGDTVRSDMTAELWAEYEKALATKKLHGVECESYPFYSQIANQRLRVCAKGVQDIALDKAADTAKFRTLSIQLSAAAIGCFLKHDADVVLAAEYGK